MGVLASLPLLQVPGDRIKSNPDIQRSPLFCANIVKKDPGRARQSSVAAAGANFTKPGAHNKGDLCTGLKVFPVEKAF